MKYFLVEFKYDHYCQGWEDAWVQALVKASTFQDACFKIAMSRKYENPREFKNLTIEE